MQKDPADIIDSPGSNLSHHSLITLSYSFEISIAFLFCIPSKTTNVTKT